MPWYVYRLVCYVYVWVWRGILTYRHTTTTLTPPLAGSLCLIYEYVDGGTLTALLRDRSRGYDLFQVRTGSVVDVSEGVLV